MSEASSTVEAMAKMMSSLQRAVQDLESRLDQEQRRNRATIDLLRYGFDGPADKLCRDAVHRLLTWMD